MTSPWLVISVKENKHMIYSWLVISVKVDIPLISLWLVTSENEDRQYNMIFPWLGFPDSK